MSTEETLEDADAEEQPSGRLTGGCVLIVLIGGPMFGIVTAAPETAYVILGVLGTIGAQRTRAWAAARRTSRDSDPESEPDPVDVGEHLRTLAAGGHHVLLTQLQKATGLPDTKAVRALLTEAGIRVRDGVRTPAGNGPGVHMDDVPPSAKEAPSEGCWCRSDANANANNAEGGRPREGLRVEPIGQAGTLITDPSEAPRHYTARAR
ncbi:hypothetical protein E3E14_25225 [Streptomyces sp. ICN441]|uniref:hypothetical protein n=1 Tax=Streptomyces sp. ICN441 TaxID=2558286 RepID=UPI00106AD6A2|nr:hypothetical protein [Streptomyces sp. ICN441]TFE42489.1 hypothetical protein E3E14_25225 [Streptomyces sp. ICN441]